MRLTTPLARVRGHGSAKDGTRHWWAQRMTAIALVPLTLWLVVMLIATVGDDYQGARAAMQSPWVAGLWVLFVVAAFHHGQLGMQVVLEDYVHDERLKFASIIVVKLLAALLGTVGVIAILQIALG